MHSRKFMGLACAALALAGCQNSDPAGQKLADNENAAILLMKVDPAPLDYELVLSTYDESQRALTANPFDGFTIFKIEKGKPYVARRVQPGTHIFANFTQQVYWTSCFQSASLAFDVKPGQILYLGEYNPLPHFRSLAEHALAAGDRFASSSDRHTYFDNIPPVTVDLPQNREGALAEVQSFVRSAMPNAKGSVALAEFRDAKFGNGTSLFGKPVCGGYFKKPAAG